MVSHGKTIRSCGHLTKAGSGGSYIPLIHIRARPATHQGSQLSSATPRAFYCAGVDANVYTSAGQERRFFAGLAKECIEYQYFIITRGEGLDGGGGGAIAPIIRVRSGTTTDHGFNKSRIFSGALWATFIQKDVYCAGGIDVGRRRNTAPLSIGNRNTVVVPGEIQDGTGGRAGIPKVGEGGNASADHHRSATIGLGGTGRVGFVDLQGHRRLAFYHKGTIQGALQCIGNR